MTIEFSTIKAGDKKEVESPQSVQVGTKDQIAAVANT
jgi:hypothetical protein